MVDLPTGALAPYQDQDIPAAMQRVAQDPLFEPAVRFVFPQLSLDQAREKLAQVRTISDFQLNWMYEFNQQVIARSMAGFSYSFAEPLDPHAGYLFVSNHRDIVLDSSLLQMVLVDNGFPTSLITYGNNLVFNKFVEDIARSNKMVEVVRDASPRQMLTYSQALSTYIQSAITQGQSCWIAQRNGRTKDGVDMTQPGVVKMLSMGGLTSDHVANYKALHIVPMAISYEYESCDFLKARECYLKGCLDNPALYKKEKRDDFDSVLTGILQPKGRVHIALGNPLDLDGFAGNPKDKNAVCGYVAHLIDCQIRQYYTLYPSHYIAYDMLYGGHAFADRYTASDVDAFLARLDTLKSMGLEQAQSIFLGIYANPVKAAQSVIAES